MRVNEMSCRKKTGVAASLDQDLTVLRGPWKPGDLRNKTNGGRGGKRRWLQAVTAGKEEGGTVGLPHRRFPNGLLRGAAFHRNAHHPFVTLSEIDCVACP